MTAERWYKENNKNPLYIETPLRYFYRWILPDPPTVIHEYDLPKEVFNLLDGDGFPQPWLYRTREKAELDAMQAINRAIAQGYQL